MGGAGGHMRHPHDLNEVGDGEDVIALFRAIPKYLKSKEFAGGESSSLKLDGSNNGLRLAYRDGRYQFVIDRGSKMELDVQGVSVDQLEDRFKGEVTTDPVTGEKITTPHGMVASSRALLDMMNEPLQEAPDEMYSTLKELGFLVEAEGRLMPDPTKYFSIEYVERVKFDHPENPELGRANVIYYPFDFIAFHGVSEFFEMVAKVGPQKGEVVRQGPKPGPEDEGPGKPIPYNRAALNKLVELVTPYAPEGFRVFGPVSLKVAAEAGEDVEGATDEALMQLAENIERALNTSISIRTSADPNVPPLTMTLEGWLAKAKNFNYKPDIKIKQIINDEVRFRKVSPFHKDIHQALINDQKSVSELVEDPEIGTDECDLSGKLYDCEKAIYGAIFLEAARILGNTVKESLMPAVEEFGPAVSHEGIVIDAGMPFGKKRTGHAFKITGEFIVDASGGAYATQTKEEPPPGNRDSDDPLDIDIVDDENIDPVVDVDFPAEPKIIALVPGSFKPPTRGHLEMVKWYADRADEVKVIVSQPTTAVRPIPGVRPKGVTVGDAMKIWELMTAGIPGVTIDKSDKASPMQVVFDEIRDDDGKIPPRSTVLLGASEKEDDKENPDWHRWIGAEEYARKDERGLPVFAVKYGGDAAAPVVYHSDDYMGLLRDLQEENHPIVQGLKQKDQEAFHASDMRYLISKAITENSMEARALLDDFVVSDVGEFLDLFALDLKKGDLREDEMQETTMSSGAVGGAPVPFGQSSPVKRHGKKRRRKTRTQKKNESIDLSLIDEIYELLSERGVIK